MSYRRTPIIFWPFVAVWKLIGLILKIVGKFTAVILGLILMIVGGVFCITVVGAAVGIPLAIFGFTMILRGFF